MWRQVRLVVSKTGAISTRRLSSVKEIVEKSIQSNDVMVFSKSYCPYCKRAKEAILAQGATLEALELDKIANGAEIQAELLRRTGQRTVPNVFVKGTHLGGCDNTLEAIQSGKFASLMASK